MARQPIDFQQKTLLVQLNYLCWNIVFEFIVMLSYELFMARLVKLEIYQIPKSSGFKFNDGYNVIITYAFLLSFPFPLDHHHISKPLRYYFNCLFFCTIQVDSIQAEFIKVNSRAGHCNCFIPKLSFPPNQVNNDTLLNYRFE